ncbi:3-oxoacyl-[acyl-carrier-protein] synthase, KASII [hydrothermal vent metagenome]|uniref:Nodulation protein E n=1 Tax=hydrothermal vent metagenome TaxID=652676 RepID=A0A3B0YY03_9ZZZZ
MQQRVAITGLGAISSPGHTAKQFWRTLVSGTSAIAPLGSLAEGSRIQIGAIVNDYAPETYFTPDKLPLLDRFSQFAVIAATEALADAGLKPHSEATHHAAAIIGTGCGGKQTDEETYAHLYKNGRTRAHPMTIPKGMPSAAACQVSLNLGIGGPVFSVASACASGAHAIIQASLLIQSGIVDIALAGGTDSPFTYGLLKSWEALRVVSNDTCRPFSANRSGMVLGEGAGMLVLESEKHARHRNARIYAELAGFGMSSDASHITRPDVNGITLAMQRALESTNTAAESVSYINAHGTGTTANDKTETEALHKAFGRHASTLAISSTKSMHGHALGASSALELVATTLAIHHQIAPPTANFTEADEDCDLDYIPNEARPMQIHAALSNAFAFGGLNAVTVVKKPEF